MKTLYVTDLDGTLLDGNAQVSPRSAELLNEAIDRGALISVATARTPATVSRLLADVRLNLPQIVMTGAALWTPGTRKYEYINRIPAEETARLIERYRRHGVSTFIYSLQDDGVIHISHIGKMSWSERMFIADRLHSPYKTFKVPADGETLFDARNPVPHAVLLFAQEKTEKLHPLYEDLLGDPACRPVYYHDKFIPGKALMEVFSPETSKAAAVETLKKITGAERVVAFGDNVNDLPNFESADLAVAVSNAIPEIKQRADIIIGSNDDDAVAQFILDDINGTRL